MSVLLFAPERVQLEPSPNSEIYIPNGDPKARQLEKRLQSFNSAAGERIVWYSLAPRKRWNCENPLTVESKVADDAQIFNIRTLISLERLKLETSNLVCALTTRCNLDGMQKLRQRGRDLVYVTWILNLRTHVNISRTSAEGIDRLQGVENKQKNRSKGKHNPGHVTCL